MSRQPAPRPRGGVVVSGAAQGIGRAIAAALAARGYTVFGTVRRDGDGDGPPLAARGVTPIRADVTDAAAVRRAAETVVVALAGQPLHALVNNAGIPSAGPLEAVPLMELRRVFEVNVIGAVAMIQAFLPQLRGSGGRVVNVSSVSARLAYPFLGPYAASKAALESLTDALRREVGPLGVAVTSVQPGSVRTPMWDRVAAMDGDAYAATPYARALARLRARVSRGAAGHLDPEAVARVVVRVLEARRPPLRVLVVRRPLQTRVLRLLPDRLVDVLIRRALGRG